MYIQSTVVSYISYVLVSHVIRSLYRSFVIMKKPKDVANLNN